MFWKFGHLIQMYYGLVYFPFNEISMYSMHGYDNPVALYLHSLPIFSLWTQWTHSFVLKLNPKALGQLYYIRQGQSPD